MSLHSILSPKLLLVHLYRCFFTHSYAFTLHALFALSLHTSLSIPTYSLLPYKHLPSTLSSSALAHPSPYQDSIHTYSTCSHSSELQTSYTANFYAESKPSREQARDIRRVPSRRRSSRRGICTGRSRPEWRLQSGRSQPEQSRQSSRR